MSSKKQTRPNDRIIAVNRRARHEYLIEDQFEAGLALEGWEAKSLRAAGLSAVTLLARKLDCAQVVLGFLKRDRIVVQALSDVAENRMNTSYTQSLAVAMAEATDQQGSVLYPPRPPGGSAR